MIYFSIILQTLLVWCVNGRPLPCTIVDEKNGAMLCCEYQQLPHGEVPSDQILDSEKKCTLMTPKTSLGHFKEVWSMRNYTWAVEMLTKLPKTKDIPRLKDCCCEEQFNFSISSHGISAQTGETLKIVQQDEYVQPILSILCVKNDNCHNSENVKLFQRMEAHTLYVQAQDHPDYLHQELLLKPSGCLSLLHTQVVKPEGGEVLIPMNLIEEANTDSRIVKRNVKYPTELPDVLRLALEMMREPNPLPVLNSVERQMALQLQHTRLHIVLALATELAGRVPYNQQGNITQTGMGSLHSYQLILSAFLAGLAVGQNFQDISQIEILDRLIVNNGDSGMNLLASILKHQNPLFAYDFNSLFNITHVDRNDTSSNKTYSDFANTTYEGYTIDATAAMNDSSAEPVDHTSSSEDYTTNVTVLVDSTAEPIDYTSSSEDYTTNATVLVDSTSEPVDHTSSSDDYTNNATSLVDITAEPIDHTSSNEDYTTNATALVDSTTEPIDHSSSSENYATNATALVDSTTEPIDNTSSSEDYTTNTTAMVDSTAEPVDHTSSSEDYTTNATVMVDSTTELVDHSSSNEDYTTNATVLVASSTESVHTSSNDEYATNTTVMVDSTVEPVISTSSNEDYTNTDPAMDDGTADTVAYTLSSEEYVTTSDTSPESEILETAFNLTTYIIELPQYQAITIDPDLLTHILFPHDFVTIDERAST